MILLDPGSQPEWCPAGNPYPRYLDTTDVETLESTSLGDDMRSFSSSALFAWRILTAQTYHLSHLSLRVTHFEESLKVLCIAGCLMAIYNPGF